MKILFSVQYFNPAKGGAEISLMSIAKELTKNHDVCVIQSGKKDDIEYLDDIKIVTRKVPIYDEHWIFPIIPQCQIWKTIINEEVNACNPDLIITQLNFAPPTVDIANYHNIPCIMFIRSYEHFCPIAFTKGINCNKNCKKCITLRNKLRYINIDEWKNWNNIAINNSDIVIANSNFVADLTEKWFNVKPEIMYPSIQLKDYQTTFQNKIFITMIKPSKGKGGDIFLKIAKAMPEKRFLAVGGNKIFNIKKKLFRVNNLEIINWTNNIENIYNQTKILLAPAIWYEPFGRVIIEAGINGIPSISSGRGGLTEAVGDSGFVVDDINDINAWKRSIELLETESIYNNYSKKAKQHSQNFNFDNNFFNFKIIVNEKLNIEL